MEAAGGKKSVYEGGRDQKAAANSSSRVDHDQAAANQVEDDQSDDQEEDHQPIFGCSSESSISFAMTLNDEKSKKKAISSGSSTGIGIGRSRGCQAERCGADLSEAKRYHRRHKVCDFHSKAPAVLVAGLPQRFCQQCSRFHEVSEFDEAKRSCRRRLAGHNERRRKASAECYGDGSAYGNPAASKEREMQMKPPHGTSTAAYKQFYIR